MSADLCLEGDGGPEIPSPPDPAASLAALSWCLRAVARGWALDSRERAACLAILEPGIPGVAVADLVMTQKILAVSRRLSGRRRDQASQLSIRFAELAEALRESDR